MRGALQGAQKELVTFATCDPWCAILRTWQWPTAFPSPFHKTSGPERWPQRYTYVGGVASRVCVPHLILTYRSPKGYTCRALLTWYLIHVSTLAAANKQTNIEHYFTQHCRKAYYCGKTIWVSRQTNSRSIFKTHFLNMHAVHDRLCSCIGVDIVVAAVHPMRSQSMSGKGHHLQLEMY